ncbi:hypothetical protein CDAR_105791 [Caerostris darwini]|uniref:Uncharacterized protein n=1 Tax=Caerostris darwini TaxID=1538125 RepID=A0AAV4TSS9_9ARAC|nr:hypothetical protein CDAR_105791 [Caerostris darwini]
MRRNVLERTLTLVFKSACCSIDDETRRFPNELFASEVNSVADSNQIITIWFGAAYWKCRYPWCLSLPAAVLMMKQDAFQMNCSPLRVTRWLICGVFLGDCKVLFNSSSFNRTLELRGKQLPDLATHEAVLVI